MGNVNVDEVYPELEHGRPIDEHGWISRIRNQGAACGLPQVEDMFDELGGVLGEQNEWDIQNILTAIESLPPERVEIARSILPQLFDPLPPIHARSSDHVTDHRKARYIHNPEDMAKELNLSYRMGDILRNTPRLSLCEILDGEIHGVRNQPDQMGREIGLELENDLRMEQEESLSEEQKKLMHPVECIDTNPAMEKAVEVGPSSERELEPPSQNSGYGRPVLGLPLPEGGGLDEFNPLLPAVPT